MLAQFEAQQKAQKIAFEKRLSQLKQEEITQREKIAKIVPTHITPPLTPIIAPKDETNLDKIGVHISETTISIDTNKTKTYINDISNSIDKKIKEIGDDLEKGIIQTKEAGIDINKKHIHIDLNKTQNLIEDWGNKVQSFVNQFDQMAKAIDTNNTH